MAVDFGSVTETFTLHMPKVDDFEMATDESSKLQGNQENVDGLDFYHEWAAEFEARCESIISQNNLESAHQIKEFLSSELQIGIPTAIVIGGYNGSDHEQFYENFKGENIVVVKVASSIKDFMAQVVTKLVGKSAFCDYDVSRLNNVQGRMVVVIPQFELIDAQILQKAIAVFRTSNLDFGLVFGVATTVDALHQHLSKNACCMLDTKTFKLVESKTIIDSIISNCLVEYGDGALSKVRLGWRPFRVVLSRFLNFDHSVLNFCDGIKYAIMSMCFSNPLVKLLDPTTEFDDISSETFEMVRMLPSFQNYIETAIKGKDDPEKTEAVNLLEDDESLFDWIGLKLDEMYKREKLYSRAFGIVLKLQELFSSQNCKKPIYYLYDIGLKEDLGDSDYIQTSLLLLRYLSFKN